MTVPGTWKGLVNNYNSCPEEIRYYFEHFPKLAKEFPLDVSISYMFGLVELAQNMTLYCGVTKLHRVDSTLTWTAITNQHITRQTFQGFYETIFTKKIKASTYSKIQEAKEIRDKTLHGKPASEAEKRKAIIDILEYAKGFNTDVNSIAGFKPFGSLRGFKGRAIALDKSASRWMLRGMGFKDM